MKDVYDFEKLMEEKLENYFSQFEALSSLTNCFPEAVFIPQTRGWAASPDFLKKLVEIVITESPKYAVELGSGVSSIYLGLALKKFSAGKLDSFDHEELFTKKTQKFLEVNGLVDIVTVRHSPLSSYYFDQSEWLWYDDTVLKAKKGIDLLVVDGPPRMLQEKSRYPALPIFIEKLSKKATIVLDDANRANELEVIDLWEKFLKSNTIKYSLNIYKKFDKGLAIISIEK